MFPQHTRYYTLCLPVKTPCQQCFHSTQCCTPHQILHSLSSCQGSLSAMFPQHTRYYTLCLPVKTPCQQCFHSTPDITLFVFLSRPLVSNVSTAHNAAPHTRYYSLSSCQSPLSEMFPQHTRYYTLWLPVKAPCQQCFHSTPDITLFGFLSKPLVSNVSTAHNAAPHTRYYTLWLPVKAPCQQCFHSTQCRTPHQILHSLSSCQGSLSAMFPQHTMLHPTPDITFFGFLSKPLVSNVSTVHNAAPHTRYYILCLPVKAPCPQCFHSTPDITFFVFLSRPLVSNVSTAHQILHSLSSCQGPLSAMFPQHTRYYILCLPVKAPCPQCFHSTPDITFFVFLSRPLVSNVSTAHQILHSLSSCQGPLSAMFPQYTMLHPTPDITLCLPAKAPCQQCFHSTQCRTPHQILHSLFSCQGSLSTMFPQYTMPHPTPDITFFVFLSRLLVSNVSTVHNAAPHTRYYTLCLPVKAPCQQCFHSTQCRTPHQILHSLSSCQGPLSAMFPQYTMLHPTPDITLVFLPRPLVSNVSTVHNDAPHTRYYTLCLPVKAPCQQRFHSTPDITLFVFLTECNFGHCYYYCCKDICLAV